MDTAKQNLGKKTREKLLHIIKDAKADDPAPGVVKEAYVGEADAIKSLNAASGEASEAVQSLEASSTCHEASA